MISRTNISVLLATALLGLLLWTVLGIVNEFGKIPAERNPPPQPEIAVPDLAVINNRSDLEVVLSALTTDVAMRIEGYSDWMLERGFPEGYSFWSLEITDNGNEYAARDSLTLISLAGSGDIGAMHALAERRLRDDPLDALTWYDQAIATGSLYAMLKTADLLETIADPQIQALYESTTWAQALRVLSRDSVAPLEKALAWSIAAVTVGGYSMVDHQHAGRINRLAAQLDTNAVRRACETAQTYVLDSAAAIRTRGGVLFSIEQPPVALTVADPASVMPCDVTVQPLIDFTGCEAHTVLAPNQIEGSLWICPYSQN